MITVLETDATEDLRPLSYWLREQGVPHRVWEASGRLHLAVPDERLRGVVEEGVRRLRAGALAVDAGTAPDASVARSAAGVAASLLTMLLRQPVTAAIVVITVVCFPLTNTSEALAAFTLRWLMIVPIERVGDFIDYPTLSATIAAGEVWRLWTPALLHFGVLHLVFNTLWLWEFGRRIELAAGARRLVEAVVVLAAAANVAQYLMDQGPRFGGMSGAVFGLLGYVLVAGRRSRHPAWRLPAALAVVLLLSLVFFSTGATEPFGLHVANGAHWGGFVAGILLALFRAPRDPSMPVPHEDGARGPAP